MCVVCLQWHDVALLGPLPLSRHVRPCAHYQVRANMTRAAVVIMSLTAAFVVLIRTAGCDDYGGRDDPTFADTVRVVLDSAISSLRQHHMWTERIAWDSLEREA